MRRFLLSVSCVMVVCLSQAASAAVFIVNEPTDLADVLAGDGLCATMIGTCSLRAAVTEANATPETDSIMLPATTLRVTAGEITITQPLVITGGGATLTSIRGNRQSRLFHIAPMADVTLSGLGLDHGKATVGGAIANEGTLRIENARLKANAAVQTGGGQGGAIYNAGPLMVSDTVFERNIAIGSGGGFGGAVYNFDQVSLSGVSFLHNRATGCGGGLYNKSGAVQIDDGHLEHNSATNSGGAIFMEDGSLDVDHTSVARNRAKFIGGGVFTYATTHLMNSTVARNRSAMGGGIFSRIAVDVTLTYVTVVENRAPGGGGILNNDSLELGNSVVANNLPSDCAGTAVTSNGHNVVGDTSCGLVGTADRNHTDPALKRTVDPTSQLLYYVPIAGSPLIDAADPAMCAADDERHLARPIDGNGDSNAICDIGAIEFQP